MLSEVPTMQQILLNFPINRVQTDVLRLQSSVNNVDITDRPSPLTDKYKIY